MVRFYLVFFLKFMGRLTDLENQINQRFVAQEAVNPTRLEAWGRFLNTMRKHAEQIGLRTFLAHVKILEAAAVRGRSVTNGDIKDECIALKKILQAEMSDQLVFVIPQRDADFFSNEPFGIEVNKHFPSARHDITEAAQSLALDRSTAAVMHLMRVLEVGLHALARYLRIPYEHNNWGAIIDQIPGRIQQIESKTRKPKNWRNIRQFLAETGADFRLLKDASGIGPCTFM